MSLFGYPADITHKVAVLDEWERVKWFEEVPLKAKVIEEQKLIKNDKGEHIHSMIEVHLDGAHQIHSVDTFSYITQMGKTINFRPVHFETKKLLGTDIVKKVILYG